MTCVFAQVNELWDFLEQGKLLPSPSSFGIDVKTLEKLDNHMKQDMHLCMEVLNMGGVDLERLMAASVEA
jgi:hypothetical protein